MQTIIDALKTPKRFEIIPAIDWLNADPFPVGGSVWIWMYLEHKDNTRFDLHLSVINVPKVWLLENVSSYETIAGIQP